MQYASASAACAPSARMRAQPSIVPANTSPMAISPAPIATWIWSGTLSASSRATSVLGFKPCSIKVTRQASSTRVSAGSGIPPHTRK